MRGLGMGGVRVTQTNEDMEAIALADLGDVELAKRCFMIPGDLGWRYSAPADGNRIECPDRLVIVHDRQHMRRRIDRHPP